MPVLRHQPGQPGAELVVEDLQAQRAGIAGRGDRAHEACHVQIALAGHVAEMARPVQQVHVDRRRIGQLDEKDLVARNRPDRGRVDLARQRVETVQDQADIRVIGAAHHLPGIAVVVDEAAPAQRLEPHANAVAGGQVAKVAEILRHAVDAADGRRMHGRTDQHQVGAQLVHQLELAFGAGEGAAAMRFGQAFEVAEGLEQRDLQPVIADHAAHFGRGEIRGQEILFEDLDPVETGGGDGGQLGRQAARQGHGGDRGLHSVSCPAARSARRRASSKGRPVNSAQASTPCPTNSSYPEMICRPAAAASLRNCVWTGV